MYTNNIFKCDKNNLENLIIKYERNNENKIFEFDDMTSDEE